jgi:Zn-dependent protease with chaperone function
MQFENPKIEEGINVSQEHPLKEFVQLLIGLIIVTVVVVFILSATAGYFAKKIPFKYEATLVDHVDTLKVEESPQQLRLQDLADQIVVHMDLPDDMKITVHYSDDDLVNAFATVGGHVFFYKGLIEKLPSENALAMVMAHEIAHVKHRHPIVAMGKGIPMMILAASITGASGSNAGEILISESMTLGLLKFSRDQELQSDLSAMHVLQKLYGNVQGAKQLFDVFNEMIGSSNGQAELFLSHPTSENRWQKLRDFAELRAWSVDAETIPLEFQF